MAANFLHIAGNTRRDQEKSGLRWRFWEAGSPRWPRGALSLAGDFLCNPVPQITDLFGGEGAFLRPQLEISVPQSLEDLTEPREMFLPCGGDDDNVVKIKKARFPVETREDAIHEAGEGSGSVAETKWDLVELVQLLTAGTKRCFLLIPLHDRDLPVPTFQIQSGEPASPV